MLTRCPHCQTAFRVTPEQLKARHGQVRCGACREVFNALDTLADEAVIVVPVAHESPPAMAPVEETVAAGPAQAEVATETVEPAAEPATPAEPEPAPAIELPPPESAESDESRRWQDGTGTDATPMPPAGEASVAGDPAPSAETVASPPGAVELPQTPAPAEDLPAADEIVPIELPAPPRRWPWALGMLVLLTVAAAQLAYIYRVELAILMPESRPVLVAACEFAGCRVPLPRRPELVSIESSDLVPADDGRLLLTAALKNRAPFDQEYPHLELTLTDTADDALVRRVLAPVDWLPADRKPAAGFPARGEAAVKLMLEAPGVPAAGYRLYLFYP